MSNNIGVVQVPFPQPISLNNNQLQNIRYFREQWKYYCIATGLDKSPEEIRVSILNLIMGREAFLFVANNIVLTDEERNNSELILNAFENYYKPKVNVIYERYMFNQAVQDENEDVDSFVNKLRKLAGKCDFMEKNEEMIRDRFIVGLRNLLVQKELLSDANLTLQRAISLVKSKEQNINDLKSLYYKIGTPRQVFSTNTETSETEPRLQIKLEKIDQVESSIDSFPSIPIPTPEIRSLSTPELIRPSPPEKRLRMDPIPQERRKTDSPQEYARKEIPGVDPNKIISSADYNVGSYVVLKEDYHNGGDPAIWKIDSASLLQKFVPFEQNGETLYKSTAVYSGWSVNARSQYYRASVVFKGKLNNRKEFTVQFRKELVELDDKIMQSPSQERKNGAIKKR